LWCREEWTDTTIIMHNVIHEGNSSFLCMLVEELMLNS